MRLKDHIQIEQGFQNSVNIAYDLYSDDRLERFIPTRSSLEVIEDAILSTADKSTDRARILIGAYGKGKSHIALVLLSLLYKKENGLFDKLLLKIRKQNPKLYNFAEEYIRSDKKLLPVVIGGNNTSLTQSFLGAIQKALSNAELVDLMPETHYQAAIKMVEKWKAEYKETYYKFSQMLGEPVAEFMDALSDYDVNAYEQFVEIYPTLTSGSIFNPFVGFDVVELYEKITEKLITRGFSGIYVIYDEFSKYLESSITKASISDIKMLQDFAEKCNRSEGKQMHLMLISHKDISNYIDKLPKTKVDGWRGVSERFKHVELHNNFSQIYEIISSVINGDENYFNGFFRRFEDKFAELTKTFRKSELYEDLTQDQLDTVIYSCYPLHPLSTFILPRLSEKVAQNERTLFTFLSSENRNTLASFIGGERGDFPMLTPDLIYDYFEPLFKKEPYTSETHKTFTIATGILSHLDAETLSAKIIKMIALIYIVGQFEKLPPLVDVIVDTYKESVETDAEIIATLGELQHKQYVIYTKKSNGYLKLKKRYDGNIQEEMKNVADKNRNTYSIQKILKNATVDSYLYPTRYNDKFEITRYFDFTFITAQNFFEVENWNRKLQGVFADGVVYGIIPSSEEDITEIENRLNTLQVLPTQVVFVVPRKYSEILDNAFEYQAVKEIRASAGEDEALIEECNIYIEDLEEVIVKYVYSYTKPETRESRYYHLGKPLQFFRKAQLSQLLSDICEEIYKNAPIINNEAINKDFLPTVAINSRNKVVTGLLSNRLEVNLGLSGSGQEVSIMRSTLVNTQIVRDIDTIPQIDFSAGDNELLKNVLSVISTFINGSSHNERRCFQELYDELTLPEHSIGLKRGIIPIFIAAVLHSYKEHCVISSGTSELLITADLLNSINENPFGFYICLEDWNEEKNQYILALETIFKEQIIEREKEYNTFSFVVKAMNRWLIALPKYAKQIRTVYRGGKFSNINKPDLQFIGSLKSSEINAREYLFEKIFEIYGKDSFSLRVIDDIKKVKLLIDNCKDKLIEVLIVEIKDIFDPELSKDVSLSSSIKEWYEKLKETTVNHVFDNANPYVLELMKNITADDAAFIEKLAKKITGLRIDDWEDDNIIPFVDEVKRFKQIVEDFDKNQEIQSPQGDSNTYKFSLLSLDGAELTKTFNKVEYSSRAKLLKNEIATALEEMGQSISEAEKRQILIELIENMC